MVETLCPDCFAWNMSNQCLLACVSLIGGVGSTTLVGGSGPFNRPRLLFLFLRLVEPGLFEGESCRSGVTSGGSSPLSFIGEPGSGAVDVVFVLSCEQGCSISKDGEALGWAAVGLLCRDNVCGGKPREL